MKWQRRIYGIEVEHSIWLIESAGIARSNKHKFRDAKLIYLRSFNFIYFDTDIFLASLA